MLPELGGHGVWIPWSGAKAAHMVVSLLLSLLTGNIMRRDGLPCVFAYDRTLFAVIRLVFCGQSSVVLHLADVLSPLQNLFSLSSDCSALLVHR